MKIPAYTVEERKKVDEVISILDNIFIQVKEKGLVKCKLCGATTIGKPHRLVEIYHLQMFPRMFPRNDNNLGSAFPYGQDLEPLSTAKINQHRMEGIRIDAILKGTGDLSWRLFESKQSYLDSFDEVEK